MAGAGNPAQASSVPPKQRSTPSPASMTMQASQPSVFQQSAGALQSGIAAARGAANFQPQQVNTEFGYTPDAVAAQQAAGGIETYMNPYTQQVIDTSMADLERQRQMQTNQLGAQASAAGAFGGSRQGVAESLTNEAFARQGGQLASGLRQQGFQTALGAAQQDVANTLQSDLANQSARAAAEQFGQSTGLQAEMANQQAAQAAASLRNQAAGQLGSLSNLGFGQGMDISRQQQQQGLAMQALNQQVIDAGRQQYAGFTGAPESSLQLPIAAVSAGNMGQGTSTGTTQQQPGLLNYLSLGASLLSDRRLKTNVKPLTERGGIKFYTWDWNDEGKRIADPRQPTVGVMADELQATHLHLVQRGDDGYLRVDYGGLAGEIGAAV